MHELPKSILEKHKEKNKEVEEYLRSQENSRIEYSIEQIKKLLSEGKIPKELGEWFLKDYEVTTQQYKLLQELELTPERLLQKEHGSGILFLRKLFHPSLLK